MPNGSEIDRLIENWSPRIRAAFLDSISQITDQAEVDRIVAMLQAGDMAGAVAAVGITPTMFESLSTTITGAFTAGAEAMAADIAAQAIYDFNWRMDNPDAEEWLRVNSSDKIVQLAEDQRDMVREFLARGMEAGKNPNNVALDLVGRIGPSGSREGGIIGLTDAQVSAVDNYRNLLEQGSAAALDRVLRDRRFDNTMQDVVDTNDVLSADQIDRMVQSYTNNMLRMRGETIGRTEAMGALHESQQQAIEQAVDDGVLTDKQVKFRWNTSLDTKVRDSHQTMEGQIRALGDMFETGDGNELEYPGDPAGEPEEIINCRCWRTPVIDFLAGIK